MVSKFSASEPALGFYYQFRYALYKLLSETETAEVSIECLDDIVIEGNPDGKVIIQLKHTKSNLTNRSLDFWKSLRVWSDLVKNHTVNVSETFFILASTSKSSQNSISYYLRETPERNTDLALQMAMSESIEILGKEYKDDTLQKSCEEFFSLLDHEKSMLFSNIYVVDSENNILEIPKLIQSRFLIPVKREHREPLYERLEGWWIERVINHLGGNSKQIPIKRLEVEDKIADLASQFGSDTLPIDFVDKLPLIPVDAQKRLFVTQLKEIGISFKRIEKAINDYYRAVEQRSRWARDDLLFGNELQIFEDRLVDEWERFSEAINDEIGDPGNEDELIACGRKIFYYMDLNTDFLRLRSGITEPYIRRGSYHMLADDLTGVPRVWWHPLFMERLETILSIEG